MSYQVQVALSIRDWEGVTRTAVNETAQAITDRGRADIAGAGRFGARWTQGLRVNTRQLPSRGYSITVRLAKPNYSKVFETGGTMRPRVRKGTGRAPLFLWIPVAPDSVGIRVRNYKGRLFMPGRRGDRKPVLMAASDRKVKYVGVKTMSLKPRFHIRAIGENEAVKFFQRMNVTAT